MYYRDSIASLHALFLLDFVVVVSARVSCAANLPPPWANSLLFYCSHLRQHLHLSAFFVFDDQKPFVCALSMYWSWSGKVVPWRDDSRERLVMTPKIHVLLGRTLLTKELRVVPSLDDFFAACEATYGNFKLLKQRMNCSWSTSENLFRRAIVSVERVNFILSLPLGSRVLDSLRPLVVWIGYSWWGVISGQMSRWEFGRCCQADVDFYVLIFSLPPTSTPASSPWE